MGQEKHHQLRGHELLSLASDVKQESKRLEPMTDCRSTLSDTTSFEIVMVHTPLAPHVNGWGRRVTMSFLRSP
jgi:hypothetical protein